MTTITAANLTALAKALTSMGEDVHGDKVQRLVAHVATGAISLDEALRSARTMRMPDRVRFQVERLLGPSRQHP